MYLLWESEWWRISFFVIIINLHYVTDLPDFTNLTFFSYFSYFSYFFFTVVKLQGDFTFVQSAKIKNYITDLHLSAASRPDEATTTWVTMWCFSMLFHSSFPWHDDIHTCTHIYIIYTHSHRQTLSLAFFLTFRCTPSLSPPLLQIWAAVPDCHDCLRFRAEPSPHGGSREHASSDSDGPIER